QKSEDLGCHPPRTAAVSGHLLLFRNGPAASPMLQSLVVAYFPTLAGFLRADYFSALLLVSIAFNRSCHESSKDLAPSVCRSAPSFATSIPTLPNSASTCSQSAPSREMTPLTRPCSPNASKVSSGMVLTVLGAASAPI